MMMMVMVVLVEGWGGIKKVKSSISIIDGMPCSDGEQLSDRWIHSHHSPPRRVEGFACSLWFLSRSRSKKETDGAFMFVFSFHGLRELTNIYSQQAQ
jgi:hypothetical protein